MTVLYAILFAFARGLKEGMVMYQPGVREHVAFWSYHGLTLAMLAAFAYLVLTIERRGQWRRYVMLAGLLLVIWEAFEIGYGIGRADVAFLIREHVNIADIISIHLAGWQVLALHAARTLLAATLMIGGMV